MYGGWHSSWRDRNFGLRWFQNKYRKRKTICVQQKANVLKKQPVAWHFHDGKNRFRKRKMVSSNLLSVLKNVKAQKLDSIFFKSKHIVQVQKLHIDRFERNLYVLWKGGSVTSRQQKGVAATKDTVVLPEFCRAVRYRTVECTLVERKLSIVSFSPQCCFVGCSVRAM